MLSRGPTPPQDFSGDNRITPDKTRLGTMSPARCFLDRMIRVGLVVELIEAGIAIRLQGAAKILQVCPRVQPFAIR
jgi:hypothetical protein